MITLKACPVCGDKNFYKYDVVNRGRLIFEIVPGIKYPATLLVNYVKCSGCGLIFQNPQMSESENNKFYSSGFYRKTMSIPPEEMDKKDLERAKTDAEIIEKRIGAVKSHLDIGCGCGYLLNFVGSEERVGMELDLNYVKIKNAKIYPGLDKIPKQKFDLVTAIHILEHVSYPLRFLKRIVKFVDKDGHLVVEVPSLKSPGGPLGLPHLSYFESDVLRLMCLKAGLTVVGTEFTPHLLLICRLTNT